MKHVVILLVALALFGFAAYAADNPVLGKWDCKSVDERGTEVRWTLVVKEDGEKLSASLVGEMGEIALLDPKLERQRFTFAIPMGPERIDVKLKVGTNTLDGTFSGGQAGTGTFKGVRQS